VKIKGRVEYRLAEVLAVTVNHKGATAKPGPGRGHKTGDMVSPVSGGKLPKGITKKQSSRAQALWKITTPP
jgi:hypothetical protein